MEMKLKDYYNRNEDGSVRAEVAFRRTDGVKESGIIPLSVLAKILGVPLVESLRWKNADFRGMILDAAHVNSDGIKCDDIGWQLEDENFEALSTSRSSSWKEHLWVSRDGESALTWQEYDQLPSEEASNYRRVDCMQVDVLSIFGVFHRPVQYYVCKEAVELLPEMLAKDVLTGDAITKRYLHECKHSLEFARQYGYALNRALVELNMKASGDSKEWQQALADILAKHAGYEGVLRPMVILPGIVDDHGHMVYGCDAVKMVEKWKERVKARSEQTSNKVTGEDLINEVDEIAYQGDNVAG